MRIAIPSTFPPFRGGISQFNEALKLSFEAAGHEVVAVNWSRQYPGLLFPGKDQTDPELAGSAPAVMDSIRPSSWRKAGRLIAAADVDVVVVPFWHAALAPALAGVVGAVREATGMRAPRIIGLIHNAGSHDAAWWDARLTQHLLGRLDGAWTLSEEVTERLQELKPDLAITTLFHPLYDHFPPMESELEAKAKLHLPADSQVLLYFGLIRPYKGLEVLLDAFAKLPSPPERPVHLVIAGECYGEWEPYQRRIDANPAAQRIQTHERFISDREVGIFFGVARLVVLPYRRASQSGVTAVALHYGKPIVASDVGGLSEYIMPGRTGELVAPSDASALAHSLEKALNTSYPEHEFESAQERFSWSAFVASALASIREGRVQ